MMAILDFATMDTTPGASGVNATFAPPAEFAGGADEYTVWLRTQYNEDPGFRQYLVTGARCKHPVTFKGPYIEGLKAVFAKLRSTPPK